MYRVKIVPVTSTIEENFALLSIDTLKKKINPLTKAILICKSDTPIGYLYTEEELRQFKEFVIQHYLFLREEEVYQEFAYDDAKYYSVLKIEGLEKHLLIIDLISKRYSMYGDWMGCITSKNQELISCILKFVQVRLRSLSLVQIATEVTVDTSNTCFKEVIREYTSRWNNLLEGLNQINDVQCNRS
ncbi:MAG: aminotransferase class I/II-fold pyridoxal phosphate-dependent enzyme [Flavobacteriales bacterium]